MNRWNKAEMRARNFQFLDHSFTARHIKKCSLFFVHMQIDFPFLLYFFYITVHLDGTSFLFHSSWFFVHSKGFEIKVSPLPRFLINTSQNSKLYSQILKVVYSALFNFVSYKRQKNNYICAHLSMFKLSK